MTAVIDSHGTFAVSHVRAVLTDRVIDDATVVVEGGRIAAVTERGPAPSRAIDGRGAFCLPGLIDTHSDGLEKEAQPRPGVRLPLDFALASFEGRVWAAGITTIFHGVAFEENGHETRTVELAEQTCRAIEHRVDKCDPLIDHRFLHRLDARDPDGLTALRRRLEHDAAAMGAATPATTQPAPLVSFEDHTPGQGQYADPDVYRTYLQQTRRLSRDQAQQEVDDLRHQRDARLAQRGTAIAWLAEQAAGGRAKVLAHDLADATEVEDADTWGAAIAEFPTSREAAEAALDAGMTVVLGAPNVLRGGSHSGNVAAEELIAAGLCTALASDYMPSTLPAAAFRLADSGAATLPAAVSLVTAGPARVAGLGDRGTLAEGSRADLVLATVDHGWPTIRSVFAAG